MYIHLPLMRKTFTWLEWLTYLPPKLCFSLTGLLPLVLCIIYFFFSWSSVPCGSDSTRRVGATGEVTSVTLLQNKDLACAKTANTSGHTCTRPGFDGVSYSFAPMEDSTHRPHGPCCLCQDMLTSLLYHGDCWGKQAVTVSWFTFNSKFSLFYLFVLITSSHSPPHTSNPPPVRPTEPRKYF